MKSIKYLIYYLVFISIVFGQELTQKDVLAKLTGKQKINEKTFLNDRHSDKNRELTHKFLFSSIKNISLEAKYHHYTYKKYKGTNVYTIIPSTTKNSNYVILGAHYDSVKDCPGANDNASGTTLVYSVMNRLKELKKRNLNIIIVFFDQEEKGLIGARAFTKFIIKKKFKIHSAHTIDQMGWDTDGDRAIELEMPTKKLEHLYRLQAKSLKIPIHVTDVTSTDHTAFREKGFNAIGLTEEYVNKDTTPHYHKNTDSYDTINFKYLKSTTNLVVNVFRAIIN
jgi:Zn-dependent M28 family amino/carboxypeptidase